MNNNSWWSEKQTVAGENVMLHLNGFTYFKVLLIIQNFKADLSTAERLRIVWTSKLDPLPNYKRQAVIDLPAAHFQTR